MTLKLGSTNWTWLFPLLLDTQYGWLLQVSNSNLPNLCSYVDKLFTLTNVTWMFRKTKLVTNKNKINWFHNFI